MICPLRIDHTQITGDHNELIDYHYGECAGHNCGIWDEKRGQCSIVTIAGLKVAVTGLVNTHPA